MILVEIKVARLINLFHKWFRGYPLSYFDGFLNKVMR